MKVFTDGSAKNNGKPDASAAIGIFFGIDDIRNVSEKLHETLPQTNNFAELTAIQKALTILESTEDLNTDITIFTDSEYSIKCLTVWWKNWKINNWKNSKGETVKNKDLIQNIIEKMNKFSNLRLQHILSHTNKTDENSMGNHHADSLAKAGIHSL